MNKEEQNIAEIVAAHLDKLGVDYRFDVVADLPMSKWTAARIKKRYKHKKYYPDLFIAEPRGEYCGMYIELKKDIATVYRKDGTLRSNAHIQGQFICMQRLANKRYKCFFGCGWRDTIEEIDWYLGL